jgi:hypothetical protein
MEIIKNYGDTLSRETEHIEDQERVRFLPKNSKRDKKRYKRNIKKIRRSFFKDAVENKTFDTTDFQDTIDEWYDLR